MEEVSGRSERRILPEYQFASSHILSIPLALGDLPLHSTLFFNEESKHTIVYDARGGTIGFEPEVAAGEFFNSPLQK